MIVLIVISALVGVAALRAGGIFGEPPPPRAHTPSVRRLPTQY